MNENIKDAKRAKEVADELQARINSGKGTANDKARLADLQSKFPTIKSGGNTAPPATAGDPNLNKNVTDAKRAAEVAAELQKRVDADKATANEKARLADLQAKFPANSGGTTPPANTQPPAESTPAPITTQPAPTTNSPVTDTINPGTPGLTPEDTSAIERTKAIMGIGETFGRKLADEFYSDGSLGRMEEALTPEELASLDQIKQFAGTVGNQTQQTADLVNTQQGILQNAQELSPLEMEALGVSRDALQGLSAPQLEALRSQARANITGAFQSSARQLAKAQASNQVTGAAATAQNRLLGQDRVRETRNLERDLLVKDIDIKAAARKDFTDLVSQTESSRAGRTNAASGQLSNTILGDENNRNTAKNTANANYAATSTTLGDRLRQLKEYNINQAAAEKAGQLGSIFGGIGTITDQRGLLAGEDFANKQFLESKDVQERIFQIVQDAMKKSKGELSIAA